MERLLHTRRRRRASGATPHRDPTDALLLEDLARTFAAAADRAGDWLVCRPGCSQCCAGPFPITLLDVVRLSGGIARARRDDPPRAERIQARARDAVRRLRDGFPGDPHTGRLDAGESTLDRFFERHRDLACPVLDPSTGRCELYDQRPVACRTYGPPLRHGDRDALHCGLCFVGAAVTDLDRCRVEPDADGLEQALLARLGVQGGDEWETLIAFAVLE